MTSFFRDGVECVPAFTCQACLEDFEPHELNGFYCKTCTAAGKRQFGTLTREERKKKLAEKADQGYYRKAP